MAARRDAAAEAVAVAFDPEEGGLLASADEAMTSFLHSGRVTQMNRNRHSHQVGRPDPQYAFPSPSCLTDELVHCWQYTCTTGKAGVVQCRLAVLRIHPQLWTAAFQLRLIDEQRGIRVGMDPGGQWRCKGCYAGGYIDHIPASATTKAEAAKTEALGAETEARLREEDALRGIHWVLDAQIDQRKHSEWPLDKRCLIFDLRRRLLPHAVSDAPLFSADAVAQVWPPPPQLGFDSSLVDPENGRIIGLPPEVDQEPRDCPADWSDSLSLRAAEQAIVDASKRVRLESSVEAHREVLSSLTLELVVKSGLFRDQLPLPAIAPLYLRAIVDRSARLCALLSHGDFARHKLRLDEMCSAAGDAEAVDGDKAADGGAGVAGEGKPDATSAWIGRQRTAALEVLKDLSMLACGNGRIIEMSMILAGCTGWNSNESSLGAGAAGVQTSMYEVREPPKRQSRQTPVPPYASPALRKPPRQRVVRG